VTNTADSRQAGRSRLYRLLMAHRGRLLLVAVILGGIGCYVIGLNVGHLDIAAARQAIQQLRADNQKLKTQISDQSATQVALQTKLSTTEAALEAIVPSKNTYNIKPNESLIVAGGRLTIGLVGPPTNDTVNININGKQQSVATGDVINIALDPPTTCQVRIQSFDMFRVVFSASCATAQGQ
jgi:hypothetical protein